MRVFNIGALALGAILLMGVDGDELAGWGTALHVLVGGLSSWAGSRSGVRELRGMLEAHLMDAGAHRRES
jgi:hypothetical protein